MVRYPEDRFAEPRVKPGRLTGMTRTLLLALCALALAGCGTETAAPGDPVASPTAVPAAGGLVQTTYAVTVLDAGSRPELCVGGGDGGG